MQMQLARNGATAFVMTSSYHDVIGRRCKRHGRGHVSGLA